MYWTDQNNLYNHLTVAYLTGGTLNEGRILCLDTTFAWNWSLRQDMDGGFACYYDSPLDLHLKQTGLPNLINTCVWEN